MLSITFRKEVGIGSMVQQVVLDSLISFLTSSSVVGVRDSSKRVGGVSCIAVDSISFSSSCMRGGSIKSLMEFDYFLIEEISKMIG